MPINRDEWFDDDGNMDFEEVQEDLSFAADMIGVGQRAQTNAHLAEQNRLLKAEQAERRRVQSLPKCPRCKVALDHQPSLCRGCGAEFYWDTYWESPNCVLKEEQDQYLKQEYATAHETMVSDLSSHVAFIESTVDSMTRMQRVVEDRISSGNKYIEPLLDESISELLPRASGILLDDGERLNEEAWQERDVSGSPLRLFLMGFWWSTFGEACFYLSGILGFGSAYLLWDRNLSFWLLCLLWIVCVVGHGILIALFVDGFKPFVNSLRKTGVHAKTNACRKAGLTAHIKESFAIAGELELRKSLDHIRGLNRISWLRGNRAIFDCPSRSSLELFVARRRDLTSLGDCTLRRLARTLHEDRLELMRFEEELLSLLLKDGQVSAESYKSRVSQLNRELKWKKNQLPKSIGNDVDGLIEDLKQKSREKHLNPEKRDSETGSAVVFKTFQISQVGTIAGCRVMHGTIERDCRIKVIRENRVIGDYSIDTLRREKDNINEIRQGMECGIKLQGFNDVKEADILKAYKAEKIGAWDSVRRRTKKGNVQGVNYWIKRVEAIRGPFKRPAILKSSRKNEFNAGDQIANSKDGPWQTLTKEHLQQMHQGSDIEIT